MSRELNMVIDRCDECAYHDESKFFAVCWHPRIGGAQVEPYSAGEVFPRWCPLPKKEVE